MKVKKELQGVTKKEKRQESRNDAFRNFALVSGCALLSVSIAVGSKFVDNGDRSQVYAASEAEENMVSASSERGTFDGSELPTGIAGVVSGVSETPAAGTRIKRIGTSCENVLVGQRVKVVEDGAARLNVSSSMENTVENLDQTAAHMAENPTIMSDEDYDVFLRIVEAEAGTEDLKGRILVANVILNRVKNDEFPDTVTDVVWDYRYGVPQFSPTYDGRIYQVTVTDKTREAVKQSLEGVDYSQGALFFVEKEAAEKKNVAWFEKDLQKLFKYGVHEFYKYPDEVSGKEDASSKDASSPKDDSSSDKNNDQETVVQMVKNDIKN